MDQVADALEEAAGRDLGVGPQVGDRGHGGEQDQAVGGTVAPLPIDEPFDDERIDCGSGVGDPPRGLDELGRCR